MAATGMTTALGYRTVLASAVVAIGLAAAASAWADWAAPDPVDLKVVDRDTGQTLRTWRHHGHLFVAGEPGERYSLRVVNHTDGRVLLVMTVDGVNILTGETADFHQNGYVLTPYESYDVTGWRKSHTEVAAFAFAPLPQSYAARTGRPTDVGVIGMAVFKEWAPAEAPLVDAPALELRRRDESRNGSSDAASGYAYRGAVPPPPAPVAAPPSLFKSPAPAAASRSKAEAQAATGAMARQYDERLGTAHGTREWSVVSETTFVRATPYPWYVRQIQYDTYPHLVASGVIPPSPHAVPRPRAFPLNADDTGFVPDPPSDP